MQVIGFRQEVVEFTFADDKRSSRDWFNPADSAALTPVPRLAEIDLRHSLQILRKKSMGTGPEDFRCFVLGGINTLPAGLWHNLNTVGSMFQPFGRAWEAMYFL